MKETKVKSIIAYFRKRENYVNYDNDLRLLQVTTQYEQDEYKKYLEQRGFVDMGDYSFVNENIDMLVSISYERRFNV